MEFKSASAYEKNKYYDNKNEFCISPQFMDFVDNYKDLILGNQECKDNVSEVFNLSNQVEDAKSAVVNATGGKVNKIKGTLSPKQQMEYDVAFDKKGNEFVKNAKNMVKTYDKEKFGGNLLSLSVFDVALAGYAGLSAAGAVASLASGEMESAAALGVVAYLGGKNFKNEVFGQDFEDKASSEKAYVINKFFQVKSKDNKYLFDEYSRLLSQFDRNDNKSKEWFKQFLSGPEIIPKGLTRKEFISNSRDFFLDLEWGTFNSKESIAENDIDNLFSKEIPSAYRSHILGSLKVLKKNNIKSISQFAMVTDYLSRLFGDRTFTQTLNRLDRIGIKETE